MGCFQEANVNFKLVNSLIDIRNLLDEVRMQLPEKNPLKKIIMYSNKLIKHPYQFFSTDKLRRYNKPDGEDIDTLPTTVLPVIPSTPEASFWQDEFLDDPDAAIPEDVLDIGSMSTVRLMVISGMMRAVHPPVQEEEIQERSPSKSPTDVPLSSYGSLQAPASFGVNGRHTVDIFGKTQQLPRLPAEQEVDQQEVKSQPAWRAMLNNPVVKISLGLLLGVSILFLISRFVDIPTTLSVLRQHLTTTQGVIYALLAAASFIAAFSIRGTRWRLFLSRICEISVLSSIQVFWVAVFLNFLLPVQGGEVAKSLILKRIKRVPISQSLPTVAMDKSLDLMPALFIMVTVPFIPGIHMSATLWIILGMVSSILLGIIFTVALMAWNRVAATKFIRFMLKVLPKGIGVRIEGFALGFVDSLLGGASSPKTFIPAILLTCLAVTCDGFFAWFSFLTVGVSMMNFGTAIFGYTTYNMFSILPNPPGQVGSNELAGELVFGGLLGFPRTSVLAMFVFSHPLAALIMTIMCVVCLSSLGISLTSAMKMNVKKDHASSQVAEGQGDDDPTTDHLIGSSTTGN